MRVEIISVGEELLSGDSDIVDTNSIYITKQLANVGLRVFYKTTVGDDEQRITDVIKLALSRADIVITSGGLGPTVDDMTRQGIANAVGRNLEFRQELLDDIALKFQRFNSRMSDNNRVQAMLPEGAIAMNNAVGTAPGFIVEHDGKAILSVPGVPREMRYLMENAVQPYLAEKYGATGTIKIRVLRTAGIGESLIDERIGEFEKLENPTVGLAAHSGQTDIRIYARAQTEAEADKLIADVEQKIRERMDNFIYGVDKEPLDFAFVAALCKVNAKVAFIEGGTNGLFNKRLEAHPEATNVVSVGESYPTIDDLAAHMAELEQDNSIYRNKAGVRDANAYKVIAEALVARLVTHNPDAVAIVLLSDEGGTAIAVQFRSDQRSRTYAYGGASLGGPEWASGWALSMGWHMITAAAELKS
jgi:nicotinamide-nucleotide amidase